MENFKNTLTIVNGFKSSFGFTEVVPHNDNNAMGDNFALVFPEDVVVRVYAPNVQYDTWHVAFDDERTGMTNIEEFDHLVHALGYISEQVRDGHIC